MWAGGNGRSPLCAQCPNTAHAHLSGLATLSLGQMKTLFLKTPAWLLEKSGYIDMPPFPRYDAHRRSTRTGQQRRL
ncbi:MAG: hypothetical protein M5U34_43915 [Chloroflexi bacterium]|nr:hypothetical protein [Chloroflexota bacterium]